MPFMPFQILKIVNILDTFDHPEELTTYQTFYRTSYTMVLM